MADIRTADASARSYEVRAETRGTGIGEIHTKHVTVAFDSSPDQGDVLPGPADLLTAAFAACIIKNVERMGEILPFRFERASVEVHSERQDRPPKMTKLRYTLTLVTDEPDQRVALLHRNVQRHGTIYNTLADVCDVEGTIVAIRP